MSAAEPPGDGDDQLLVVIDPVARRTDGESVRIAKDVLSAGAHAKICLPDTPRSSPGPCPGGVRAARWWSATTTPCCVPWPSSTGNGSSPPASSP